MDLEKAEARKTPPKVVALALVGAIVFFAGVVSLIYQNAVVNARMTRALLVIDIAGRQRMLTQRMSKDAYALHVAVDQHQALNVPRKDFLAAAELYDQTLQAFQYNGEVVDAKGDKIPIQQLVGEDVTPVVRQDQALWTPVVSDVHNLESNQSLEKVNLAAADAILKAGPGLLKISNELTEQVSKRERSGVESASAFRLVLLTITALGIIAVIMSFFLRLRELLGVSVRQTEIVKQQAEELLEAQQNANLIMETVRHGLMLLDEKHAIQPQYAVELEHIFNTKMLTGRKMEELLRPLLTERMYLATVKYLNMLFDPTKSQKALLKVNPLDEVQANFESSGGGFKTKYLSFGFRRIVRNGVVTRLFISVDDITERYQLETDLRASEARKDRQFQMLLGILHLDPQLVDDFIAMAQEQLQKINDTLRAEDIALQTTNLGALKERLDGVYRCVHNIKGNASFLKIADFEAQAANLEQKISVLRRSSSLSGDDFLSIVIDLVGLRTGVEELETVRKQLHGFAKVNVTGASAIAGDSTTSEKPAARSMIGDLESFAQSMAQKYDKKVRIEANGFDPGLLPDAQRGLVRDVLVQLVRNSIVHGIESEQLRTRCGKPPVGTISIQPIERGAWCCFVYRDDGRGLDIERIGHHAVEKGVVSAAQFATMEVPQVASLIFEPGFSTADEVTAEAGRGVGMNVIKEAVIDDAGGSIEVASEPGAFCSFRIEIPPPVPSRLDEAQSATFVGA